jgi:hypothetical protein
MTRPSPAQLVRCPGHRGLTVRRAVGLVALACAAAACSEVGDASPTQAFDLIVEVLADSGEAVAGAQVRYEGRTVGKSDARGRVGLRVYGFEGQQVALAWGCPQGYLRPAGPLNVTLRRLSSPRRLPSFRVRCVPAVRQVVVAVRAIGGAYLPLRYLGQQLARTDRSGAAHALLRAAAGERIELQLDTGAEPELRPQSPSVVFEVPNQDFVFLFTQTFDRPAPSRPRAARRSGPTRI